MKILKVTLLLLLSLVVLLVVGVTAAINLIDPNSQKERIARIVYEKSGRELTIAGDLEWGFWPRLRLSGGELTLGNAPGFGPEPFLRLDSFHFAVATWPLLRSEVIADRVQISGLQLNLARNAAGVSNWQDLSAAGAATPEPPPGRAAQKGAPFAALALGGVEISDLRAGWRDEENGLIAEIFDLQLQVAPLRLGEPLELKLEFKAQTNQPELTAAAAVNGTIAYDLNSGNYSLQPLAATATLHGSTVPGGQAQLSLHTLLDWESKAGRARIEELRLEGLGMLLSTQMEMDGLNDPIPGCRGELKLDINDLVQLLATFESPLARQLAGVKERTVTLHSQFNAEPARGRFSLSRLEANLLGTLISGQLEATEVDSAQPQVQGALKAQGPDLPALLAVAARLGGADPQKIPEAVRGLQDRSLLLETEFGSEGAEITIPRLRAKGVGLNLESSWRLRNPLGEMGVQGEWQLAGDDLPLLLRLAAVFAEAPRQVSNREEQAAEPSNELRALAERVTSAGQQRFRLGSGVNLDLAADRALVNKFQVAALGLQLTADLKAERIRTTLPAFELELKLDPFSPRALLSLFDLPVPETADRQALTRLDLVARISGDPEKFALNPLDLRLDGSHLLGEIQVNDLSKNDLAFKLAIDRLDLDRYMPPESAKAPATPETAAAAATQLPVELLRQLRLKGEIKVAELKISGLKMQNFLIAINAADGKITVDPLKSELYGGSMAGNFNLDAAGQIPAIQTANRISGVQAGPLFRDLTGDKERIRGRAEVDYRLNSRGVEVTELKGNLNGEANFAFRDGAVVGVNIGRLLRQTSALAQGRTLAADQQELVTDFSELTGSARIINGLIDNRDLSLKSPLLRLNGAGSANLVSEEVDYLLTTTVAATAEGQEGRSLEELRGITIPIRVSGTFSELRYRPELGSLGLEQLQQNLRNLGQSLKQEGVRALEGLLGGPRPTPPQNGAPTEPESPPAPAPAKPEDQLKDNLRRLFR